MRSYRPLRIGFTLVELLVVIAIIGVLVALLLPAVQAARESARRSQCSNNIKQIVLAVHNFESGRGTVPPILATAPSGTKNGWGWLTSMLPYIEQQNLYDKINYNSDCSCKSMAVVHAAFVPAFSCPSDPLGTKMLNDRNVPANASTCVDGSGTATVPLTLFGGTAFCVTSRPSNYLGSFGDGFIIGDTLGYTWGSTAPTYGCGGCSQTAAGNVAGPDCPAPTAAFGGGPNHRGIWNYQNNSPHIRFANITDGMSNTIMVGHNSSIAGGHDMVWFTHTGNVNGTSLPINFNIAPSLAQKSFYCPGCTTGRPWRGRGFQSHHPNGSLFGMCDGSVTFLSQSIEHKVYNAMGSRQGGETF